VSTYPQPGLYGNPNLYGSPSLFGYQGYQAQSQMGAVFIAAMEPWITLPLAWYLDALGSMFDPIYTLVYDEGFDGDPDYVPGYGTIFNPLTCPAVDLPYLGQFVGVSVPNGADPTTALSLVTAEAGQNRGTLASIQAAIQRTISTPWTPLTTFAADTIITYGVPPVYYLVNAGFTSGSLFQLFGAENFVGNPSFEHDTLNATPAGWIEPTTTAPFGSSLSGGISSSTTITTFKVENGWAESGTQSLRITATYTGSGGNVVATYGHPVPITVGQQVSMGATANILTSGMNAGAQIELLFCDTNLNLIGVGSDSSAAFTGVNTFSTTSNTAPLGAAYVIPTLVNFFNTGTTVDCYWDAVIQVNGVTVPTYFDGDTNGYQWLGTVGDSYSAQPIPTVNPASQYSIIERVNSLGAPDAYWISIFVPAGSNTTAILAAIDSVKPGGILINLVASSSPSWGAATKTWGGVTAGTTWGGVAAGDV
jgi:hypothetical protein